MDTSKNDQTKELLEPETGTPSVRNYIVEFITDLKTKVNPNTLTGGEFLVIMKQIRDNALFKGSEPYGVFQYMHGFNEFKFWEKQKIEKEIGIEYYEHRQHYIPVEFPDGVSYKTRCLPAFFQENEYGERRYCCQGASWDEGYQETMIFLTDSFEWLVWERTYSSAYQQKSPEISRVRAIDGQELAEIFLQDQRGVLRDIIRKINCYLDKDIKHKQAKLNNAFKFQQYLQGVTDRLDLAYP